MPRTELPSPKVADVGKKKPTQSDMMNPKVVEPKTFAIRFTDPDIESRVLITADGLGLDPTNFLRMLVRENLATYEKRVERIKQGLPPSEGCPSS